MRAHADAAYVAPDRQRGPRRGRLARAHPRPALRARLRPRRDRPRARALHRLPPADDGRPPARGRRTEEVRRRERLVAIDDEAVLVCPWASRSPFELRVIPRTPGRRASSDDEGGAGDARDRAARARRARSARRRSSTSGCAPPRAGPRSSTGTSTSCPRLTIRAGFELGTGVDINVYPPERAASDLREALGLSAGAPRGHGERRGNVRRAKHPRVRLVDVPRHAGRARRARSSACSPRSAGAARSAV